MLAIRPLHLLGCDSCSTKNLAETIVVLARQVYGDDLDARRIGRILEVRALMLEDIDDDLDDVLQLEFVMDFFGAADQEALKKQVHDARQDDERRKDYVAQKNAWKASRGSSN